MNPNQLSPELDQILEECLRAVLRDGLTLEESLTRHPQAAEALRKPLQTALLAARLPAPTLSTERVASLEQRLLERFDTLPLAAPGPRLVDSPAPRAMAAPRRSFWMGRWAAVLALAFVFTLGSGATVAASAQAMPGDALYGVKRGWEAIITVILNLLGQLESLWNHLARVRYEELQYAIENAPEQEAQALFDFGDAFGLALANAQGDEVLELSTFAEEALRTLETHYTTRSQPETARPVLNLLNMARSRSVPTDPQLPPPPTPLPPSATPTSTATMTSTPTQTFTPTATETFAPTRTPRFAATATRTPEPSPTPEASETPTLPPTSTWTPLALPGQPQEGTRAPSATPVPGSPVRPDLTPTPFRGTVTPYWLRPTEFAVYMTQTAVAATAQATEEVNP